MNLLANENFPQDSIVLLRKWGYDVYSIGTDNPSVSDEIVMQLGIELSRTILTFDRDYGELIFRKGFRPAAGVIYLRVEPLYPEYPAEIVHRLIQSGVFHFENALTVVDENRIRQRSY